MYNLVKIDEARSNLRYLLGEEKEEVLYNEIKCEANTYGLETECKRLESFLTLARMGVGSDELITFAKYKLEPMVLLMVGYV